MKKIISITSALLLIATAAEAKGSTRTGTSRKSSTRAIKQSPNTSYKSSYQGNQTTTAPNNSFWPMWFVYHDLSKIVEASSEREAREIADDGMTEEEILSGIYVYLDVDVKMDVEEFLENDSK